IVANQNGPVKIYKNDQSGEHNWIGVNLEGTESNKSAIGAVAFLHWDDKQTKKVVSGGDSFSSQSQRSLHFGLGRIDQIDRIEIRWPSGLVQEIKSPEINKIHKVIEPVDQ
ncbi:MAG: ASPIC/UnbV domain-containing protein, partial [Balneolaceae bacterium]